LVFGCNLVSFVFKTVPLDAPSEFKVASKQKSSATFVWKPVDASRVRGELKGYKVVSIATV